jgi:hypothetical protein
LLLRFVARAACRRKPRQHTRHFSPETNSRYRDTDTFAAQCGFRRHNERKLHRMLLFNDVYSD